MAAMTNVRETHEVPARSGTGFEVKSGDLIRVTDLEGFSTGGLLGVQQGRTILSFCPANIPSRQ